MSETDQKKQRPRPRRAKPAFPEMYRQAGLVPEPTEFNKRAAAYAAKAVELNQARGAKVAPRRPVEGMRD